MTTQKSQTEKKSNYKGLLIGFIALLLALNGGQLYLYLDKKKDAEAKETVIIEKEETNKKLIASYDSLEQIYKNLIIERDKLNLDNTELKKELEKIIAERDKFKVQAIAASQIPALRSKIKEYESKISALMQELDEAKKERELLYSQNLTLKKEKQALTDSINNIMNVKEKLEEKIAIASILKADNFKVTVLTKKGKEKEDDEMSYKAKNIDRIKITFNVFENKLAKVETKTFYLRVLGPDGAVLYDENSGGGSVEVEGKDVYFTAKQDLLYDGKKQTVTFLYRKNSEWKKGKHTVEVICEGQKIGSGTFTVR
jgi:regulator of replication initiation timing